MTYPLSELIMSDETLCQWLEANSAGVYRPAAEAAARLKELLAILEEREQTIERLTTENEALNARLKAGPIQDELQDCAALLAHGKAQSETRHHG